MTKNIQQRLDTVIARVNKKLVQNEFVIPQKTERGILVGPVLIESAGALKNIYYNDTLVFADISLNKVAIKIANLLAIDSTRYQQKIDQLVHVDNKFGAALSDYQMFKDRLSKAHREQDQFKIDMYLARLGYAKSSAEYWKKQALSLVG
jgi:hypothetical protein